MENSEIDYTDTAVQGQGHRKEKCKMHLKHIGIFYGVLSSLVYSLNIIFAKVLTIPGIQVAFSRFAFQYMILIPIVLHRQNVDKILGPRKVRIHLWARGLSGMLGGLFLYLAVENLSPGNVISLSFLDIVLVPIFGRMFYKQSFSVSDAIFSLMAFSGVVLIAKPPFIFPNSPSSPDEKPIGILYGILTALCASFSYLEIGKIGKNVNPFITTLYASVIGAFVDGILMLSTGNYAMPCLLEFFNIILMGACGFFGMIFLTLAVQHERPGTICVLLSLQIIFVYFFQVFLLDDIPTTLSLVGSGLIFSTSICIGVRKLINEKKRLDGTGETQS